MAITNNFYYPNLLPAEYNPQILDEEFQRIYQALDTLRGPMIILIPQAVAPLRTEEGMVMNADGTNWNPGSGKGLYEFKSGAWNPLFT